MLTAVVLLRQSSRFVRSEVTPGIGFINPAGMVLWAAAVGQVAPVMIRRRCDVCYRSFYYNSYRGRNSLTVPSDWKNYHNSIETIGGGGGANNSYSGTGGGGGAYSIRSNVSLTASSQVHYEVGSVGGGGAAFKR